jgi:hypothetical protein
MFEPALKTDKFIFIFAITLYNFEAVFCERKKNFENLGN